jgi:general stress protein 26
MWLALADGMGLSSATIEMRTPEEHRERLHELVKSTRTVIVLSCTSGALSPEQHEPIDGKPMPLVRTDDDTTMYLAGAFDGKQAAELERAPRVTVVVQGAGYALFSGEARLSRARELIDELWNDSWARWCRGKWDPTIGIVIVSPIEGSYWESGDRHSYLYRLVEHEGARRGCEADGRTDLR